MGTLTKGYSFGATEEVTAAKLSALVDDGSVSGIVSADITDGTIVDANISSVSGSKFIGLANIPSGSGDIPEANLPTSITQATTYANLTATTADINGGTIDGATVGANSASTVKATSLQLATGATCTGIADEDAMGSNSATLLATQQSIKAYVDSKPSPAIQLLSTTTVTSATNSGDISITAGRKYMVFFELTADAGAAVTATELRFDSDSGAADYAWLKTTQQWSATPSPTTTGDDSDDSIILAGMAASNTITGNFTFDSNADAANYIYVRGSYMNTTGVGTFFTEFFGAYKDAGTLTDFEFFSDKNMTGTIKTYEIT